MDYIAMNSRYINLCLNFLQFPYYRFLEGTECAKILLAAVAVKRTVTSLSWRPASHMGRFWKGDNMWVCVHHFKVLAPSFESQEIEFSLVNTRFRENSIIFSRNVNLWNQDYYLQVKWNIHGIWSLQLPTWEPNSSTSQDYLAVWRHF